MIYHVVITPQIFCLKMIYWLDIYDVFKTQMF